MVARGGAEVKASRRRALTSINQNNRNFPVPNRESLQNTALIGFGHSKITGILQLAFASVCVCVCAYVDAEYMR